MNYLRKGYELVAATVAEHRKLVAKTNPASTTGAPLYGRVMKCGQLAKGRQGAIWCLCNGIQTAMAADCDVLRLLKEITGGE